MTPTSSHALSLDRDAGPLSTGDDIATALGAIERGLDLLCAAALDGTDDQRTRDLLLWAARNATRLAAFELRLLRHGDQVDAGRRAGASSTATWLALAVRRSKKSTHFRARLARDLLEHPDVERALIHGEVDLAQARAILDETRSVAPADRAAAVTGLVTAAGVLGAESLRVEGRRTLRAVADVPVPPEPGAAGETTAGPTPYGVAPEDVGPSEAGTTTAAPDDPRPLLDPPGGEVATEAGPEAPEQEAEVGPGPALTMRTCPATVGPAAALDLEEDTSEPFVCGHFVIPRAVAAQLREALQALLVADDPGRPADSDLGRAFCALITRIAAQDPTTAVTHSARRTARRRLRLRATGRSRVAATA